MSEVPDAPAGELDAARAARRRRVFWAFVGAVVLMIGVSVPVGLVARGSTTEGAGPGAPPVSPPRTPTPVPAPPPTTPPSNPVTTPRATPPTTPPVTTTNDVLLPPPGLSAPERALWTKMAMGGVNSDSCHGYPPGESIQGVAASLQCAVWDAAMEQPIIYYQFASAAAMSSYIALRASDVDRSGTCENGDEYDGSWKVGGSTVGPMVCVDNINNNVQLFKIVFASTADNTAVVVQDNVTSTVIAWWHDHAADQFAGL